jgi:hypothetical protein
MQMPSSDLWFLKDILKHIHSHGYTLWLQILGGKHFCDRCVMHYVFAYLQFKISLVHKNRRTKSRIFVLTVATGFPGEVDIFSRYFSCTSHTPCNWTRTSLHEHEQFPCLLLLHKSLSRSLRTCTTAASAAQTYISSGPKITLFQTT